MSYNVFTKSYEISDALQSLRPGSQWSVVGNQYSGINWLPTDVEKGINVGINTVQPTENEINTKIKELNDAEPMRLLREERDKRLLKTDWVVIKSNETGVGISTEWKTYRQSLRDLPTTQTPVIDTDALTGISSVTWPTAPS